MAARNPMQQPKEKYAATGELDPSNCRIPTHFCSPQPQPQRGEGGAPRGSSFLKKHERTASRGATKGRKIFRRTSRRELKTTPQARKQRISRKRGPPFGQRIPQVHCLRIDLGNPRPRVRAPPHVHLDQGIPHNQNSLCDLRRCRYALHRRGMWSVPRRTLGI